MPTPLAIDVRGLEKTYRSKILYRRKPVLRGLDLAVEEGEIYGFLGPNGAGKTTTIRILLGLVRPTAGTGTLLGRAFGARDARRDLGFVPDSPNFYLYLTARELLDFTGRLHGLTGGLLRVSIEATLDRVGLPDEARGRALKTYSRGMLQRTGIAAAILHRPKLVVLDEPMNGLDPIGRREFRDLILSLKETGTTVFLSSHVLADIESTADRVGILHGGRIVRSGTLDEVMSDGRRGVEIVFDLPKGVRPDFLPPRIDAPREGAMGWIVATEDPKAGGEVVRRVLARGGQLLGFHRSRVSLEECFLREIAGAERDAGDDGGGATGDASPRDASVLQAVDAIERDLGPEPASPAPSASSVQPSQSGASPPAQGEASREEVER